MSDKSALATAAAAGVAIGAFACMLALPSPTPLSRLPSNEAKQSPLSEAAPLRTAPSPTHNSHHVPLATPTIFKEPPTTRGGSMRPSPIDTKRPSVESTGVPMVPSHTEVPAPIAEGYSVSLLFQRVDSLKLSHDSVSRCIQSNPGLCVYVSFSKTTVEPQDPNNNNTKKKKKKEKDKLAKAAETIINVKLLRDRKRLKDVEGERSLTLIPSANLTSKIKKYDFQYRNQIGQTEAKFLYTRLKDEIISCVKALTDADKLHAGFGEFGETQELELDSRSGPLMHFLTL
ncbi:hypothetical protein TrST_g13561 [Triparma strigata]|uniref:Uncharacterized protein n=1 Tax=Triparma strigata TaxID=1606541 RepID=A0A9W7DZJ7_9STRA|nr:hypothetical protein TrST_g13561 [Triparma strigata]